MGIAIKLTFLGIKLFSLCHPDLAEKVVSRIISFLKNKYEIYSVLGISQKKLRDHSWKLKRLVEKDWLPPIQLNLIGNLPINYFYQLFRLRL